ncbi:MAG: hypothetical protein NTX79_03015 [Candidatus Micrarchaeota archaeon]|nr:hypothetical protein [Candidatus Micrarchaeota archaeon]
MIDRKYWIPVALVAIFLASVIASHFVTDEMLCGSGDDSAECQYHHFCLCGNNIWGVLITMPALSILGLVLWLIVFLALWLFGKFKKRKK